jgi:hypothetical protein
LVTSFGARTLGDDTTTDGFPQHVVEGTLALAPLADVPRGQQGRPFCAVDVVAEVIDDASGRTNTYVLPVVPET